MDLTATMELSNGTIPRHMSNISYESVIVFCLFKKKPSLGPQVDGDEHVLPTANISKIDHFFPSFRNLWMDTSFIHCVFLSLSPFGAPATHMTFHAKSFPYLLKQSPCCTVSSMCAGSSVIIVTSHLPVQCRVEIAKRNHSTLIHDFLNLNSQFPLQTLTKFL